MARDSGELTLNPGFSMGLSQSSSGRRTLYCREFSAEISRNITNDDLATDATRSTEVQAHLLATLEFLVRHRALTE